MADAELQELVPTSEGLRDAGDPFGEDQQELAIGQGPLHVRQGPADRAGPSTEFADEREPLDEVIRDRPQHATRPGVPTYACGCGLVASASNLGSVLGGADNAAFWRSFSSMFSI
jgi:hypothetical protein